ncbi:MAG: hypothetical protein WC509_05895 [Candidatus Izemoplasmatales bacterium]
MTIGQLQMSFSRYKTASAVEKSLLPAFFLPIPLFVILLNAGIFMSLYLSGSPIEFNGVLRTPGDPLYEAGFWSLIRFFVLFSAIFLTVGIAILVRSEKRRHWLSIDADGRYAILVVTRHKEILTLPGSTHEYDRRSGRVASTTQSRIAPTPFDPVFFWAFREQEDETWKVREKPGRIILKRTVGPTGVSFASRRILTWSIRLDESGRPLRATYSVGQGSSSSYSMTSLKRFVYADVGASLRMPIRPELRAVIEDPTIASML